MREDFPANSAKELIDLIRGNPDKYTLGNDGIGNTMQLAAERIFGHFGAKVRQVPFNGAGETARNFLGGHVDLYGGSILAIMPHVKAGKAKCPMLTSADDNPALPNASGLSASARPNSRPYCGGDLACRRVCRPIASRSCATPSQAMETPMAIARRCKAWAQRRPSARARNCRSTSKVGVLCAGRGRQALGLEKKVN